MARYGGRSRVVGSLAAGAVAFVATDALAQSCDLIFPIRGFETGCNARPVRAADLNGDGHIDLVVASWLEPKVGVLLGRGDGRFDAPALYVPRVNAYDVFVADFTGDGVPDILVRAGTDYPVEVLPGIGDGTFGSPVYSSATREISSMDVADFTGDGLPDIVLSSNYAEIVVFVNAGEGRFSTEVSTATTKRIHGVRAGDLDGDGRADVVGMLDQRLLWAFGKGDGAFEKPISTPGLGGEPIIADADADGVADIAVHATDHIVLRFGLGRRVFSDPLTIGCCGDYVNSIGVADFDADGLPDVISTHGGRETVIGISRGLGGRAFADPVFIPEPATEDWAAADLDHDGFPDLVFSYGDFVTVVRNDRGTLATVGIDMARLGPDYGADMQGVDADGNGLPDMMLADGSGATILYGDGRGGIVRTEMVPAASTPAFGAAVGDADGDGVPDVIMLTDAYGRAWVHRGRGDGTFDPPVDGLRTGYRPYDAAAGDFNGDGVPDLVTADNDMTYDTVSFLAGEGGGRYAARVPVRGGVLYPYRIIVRDFDGDGDLDIATTGSNGVGVVAGRGDGTFGAAWTLDAGVPLEGLVAADFNADGLPDLAAGGPPYGSSGPGVAIVLLALPQGGFSLGARFDLDRRSGGLAAADLNGDGREDLVLADGTRVYLGRGDGSFEAPVVYWLGGFGKQAVAGDFDSDGLTDLAFHEEAAGRLWYARNTGRCAACRPDCDGSGRLDINDFVCFQEAWRARRAFGDFDRSGRFDVNDFIAFTAEWRGRVRAGGCP